MLPAEPLLPLTPSVLAAPQLFRNAHQFKVWYITNFRPDTGRGAASGYTRLLGGKLLSIDWLRLFQKVEHLFVHQFRLCCI